SRGAEKEADRLGAQYMWASGYDPNALVTFFEKLQAKDKKKPGTLSKLFSTHPMTGDRITEMKALIGQFPDHGENQNSTTEFSLVKTRVTSTSGATRASGRDGSGRPTLKRRPQTTTGDESGGSDTPNRPVLKRRDSSGDDPNDAGAPAGESGRPTLKRREGADSGDQTGGSSHQGSPQQSQTPAKPTLKRPPHSNNN